MTVLLVLSIEKSLLFSQFKHFLPPSFKSLVPFFQTLFNNNVAFTPLLLSNSKIPLPGTCFKVLQTIFQNFTDICFLLHALSPFKPIVKIFTLLPSS